MRDIITYGDSIRHKDNTPKDLKGEKIPYNSFFGVLDLLAKNDLDAAIDFMTNDEKYKKALELDFAIKREVYINGVKFIVPSPEQTEKQKTLLREYNDLLKQILTERSNDLILVSEPIEDKVEIIQEYKYQSFFSVLDTLADYDANWVLDFINNRGDIYNRLINLDFTIKRVCFGLGHSDISLDNYYVKGLLADYEGLLLNLIRAYNFTANYHRMHGDPEPVVTLFNKFLDPSLLNSPKTH